MKSCKHSKEPLEKLMLELAYIGPLFWLPLVVCPGDKTAKFHANQGLWVLIVSTLACSGVRLMGFLAARASGLAGAVLGLLNGLVYIGFLFGMLYLVWNIYQQAMRIHRGQEPKSLWFFESAALLR